MLIVGEDYLEAHWEEGRGWRHFFHIFIVAGCKKVNRALVLEVKLSVDFSQIVFKNFDHFMVPLLFCSSNLSLQLSSYLLAYILLLGEDPIQVFLVLKQARRHILFKYPLDGPFLKFLLLNQLINELLSLFLLLCLKFNQQLAKLDIFDQFCFLGGGTTVRTQMLSVYGLCDALLAEIVSTAGHIRICERLAAD